MWKSKSIRQVAFNYANDGILVYVLADNGEPGGFIEVNDRACTMSGYRREELLEMTPRDICRTPPEKARKVLEELSRVHHSIFETILFTKDGDEIPVESSNYLVSEGKNTLVIVIMRDIAERYKAEYTLKRAHETLNALIHYSPLAIVCMDLDAKVTMWNPAAEQIFGWSEQEVLGRKNPIIPDSKKKEYDSLRKKVQEGSPYSSKILQRQRKDGSLIYLNAASSALYDENGNVTSLVGMFQDITTQKRAEERLIVSEKRFRAAFENASVGASMVDLKGRFIKVNRFLCDMLGYSEKEMLSMTFSDVTHPDDVHIGMDAMKAMISPGGKEHASFEKRSIRKDGRMIYIIISPALIRDGEGNPIYFVSLLQDITSRKLAENALAENEEKYRTLVETAPYGIQIADRDGLIVFSNKVHHEIQGYKEGEIVGKKYIWDFIASDEVREATKDYYRMIMDEHPEPGVVFNKDLTNDGRLIDTQINWNYMRDGKGDIIGTYSIISDVTERRQAEEKIRASLKEKEVLLKEIHHRVKNNMAIISSLIRLQSTYSRDERIVWILKDCQDRIASMALVHEKLYQTRDFTNINFKGYIEDLAEHLLRTYGRKEGDVGLELSVDDINLNIDIMIPCGLILNELVTNSLKHAFESIEMPKVCISFQVAEGQAVLVYCDNGTGIPGDVNFPTGETLGLQIVYMLARQMGGSAEMERENGTTFTIRFRLAT